MSTVMTTAPINTATLSDADQVIATLVLAFSADPFVRHWYSEPQRYLTHFPNLVRGFGGGAFEQGTADYLEGYAGAALWLPPYVQPDEEALIAHLQRSVAQEKHTELFQVLEQMSACQPSEPHWHLPLIGVDPGHQHKGFGSALLAHSLRRCDRENTLAYLEATSPRNIPLYERHGFEMLGTIQAGASAPLFPMLRRPRPWHGDSPEYGRTDKGDQA